jgi:hypothetical protein
MTEIIRNCPDCGHDRAFAQHHEESAWCPDAADGDCPEWYCLECGATVLTGEIFSLIRPRSAAATRGERVA